MRMGCSPKRAPIVLALMSSFLLASCGPETGAGFAPLAPVPQGAVNGSDAVAGLRVEGELSALINAERARHGLPALQPDARLQRAAQAHAEDMVARGYFSHRSKSGTRPVARVKAAGFEACFVAENLSRGYATPRQSVTGWMQSPGHRDNILSSQARAIGIGVAAGATYVTVFAAPC